MSSQKDDLVLRPRWRASIQLFDLPSEFNPAIDTVILEPKAWRDLD